ncbi:hypothetical protein [Gordonia sputi]
MTEFQYKETWVDDYALRAVDRFVGVPMPGADAVEITAPARVATIR